jgi:hypothetical protein
VGVRSSWQRRSHAPIIDTGGGLDMRDVRTFALAILALAAIVLPGPAQALEFAPRTRKGWLPGRTDSTLQRARSARR